MTLASRFPGSDAAAGGGMLALKRFLRDWRRNREVVGAVGGGRYLGDTRENELIDL